MTNYTLRNEDGDTETIAADCADDAWAQGEEWIREGDWDTSDGTVHVELRISEEHPETDDYYAWSESLGRRLVRVDPLEPDCVDGEGHEWDRPHSLVGGIEENPGVWGHGGGVIINEACMRCGCRRRTDTWAQHPETGEQGLESVEYRAGYYDLTGDQEEATT